MSEIYLVNIINNWGGGKETSCQENVTQISERPLKSTSWKSLEGKITLTDFLQIRVVILSSQSPLFNKNEAHSISGTSSNLFIHSYNHSSHYQEIALGHQAQ